MNNRLHYISTTLFCAIVFLLSCTRNEVSPEPKALELTAPVNFPAMPSFPDNQTTIEGVELGRKLFFDKRLSGNNLISCASCHIPERAFSDGVQLTNVGVSGSLLHRHTPALINMAWMNNGLFWDGGSNNLESQAFGPLSAEDEMHQNLLELEHELKEDPEYVKLFLLAFNDEIKSNYAVKALAQFQRTLISANSRYDKHIRKENGGYLTAIELNGLNIVKEKCQHCHSTDLFTDNNYHNNGIDDSFNDNSHEELHKGRARITYNTSDLGKFKTPTLRNIMVTSPYMHDGRFNNIEEVLEHYNSKVKYSVTLDEKMKQMPDNKPGIPMSREEKDAVIAFLHTLTDNSFLKNKLFEAP